MRECPNPEFHGNPFRYCACGWTEMLDTPAPAALVDGPEVARSETARLRAEVERLRAQWDALTSDEAAEAVMTALAADFGACSDATARGAITAAREAAQTTTKEH